MTEPNFDFAITGNSVFAAALALSLSRKHGKRVCLIGHLPAPLQIARDIALSVGPYTRPETLRLLVENRKQFNAMLPASVFERREIVFAARDADGWAGAGHVRQILSAIGVVTRQLPHGKGPQGFVAEGVQALKPRAFFAGLPAWLADASVTVFETVEDLHVGQDRVRFAAGHDFVTARTAIIADGVGAQSLATLPGGVVIGWRTALLTEPVDALANTLLVDVEANGFLVGRSDGRLEASVPSETDAEAHAWLGGFLPKDTRTRIIARTRFPVVLSRDGGPVVAPVSRKAAIIAAGFGVSAAYLVPALAEHLAGTANTMQASWFAARTGGAKRAPVADIGLVGGGAP